MGEHNLLVSFRKTCTQQSTTIIRCLKKKRLSHCHCWVSMAYWWKKNWHFFLKKQQIGNFCLATSSFWQVWIFPTLPRKNGRLCLSTLRKMIEKWRVFAQRSFTHSHEKWKCSIWKLKMKRLMFTYHLMKVVDFFLYYRCCKTWKNLVFVGKYNSPKNILWNICQEKLTFNCFTIDVGDTIFF